ncbi:3-hydroxybenzoate 4-monooxygenase [Rhodobacterales bacterium HKCCE2091]|nr:3-hydroxybenzoate 4-monooxygenase [Rhodobacterales bacterium HKCCE2091]
MQFHLDGVRLGDPVLLPERDLEAGEDVDVIVVGSGPTGLTLATQLCAFPGLTVRVLERKPGPLEIGQADGIAVRTMEMFQAFGFADRVAREAYWVSETAFWRPDPADPARITRTGRIDDVEEGLSEFPHVILNQARVHDFYLEKMAKSPSRLVPDYDCAVTGITVDRGAEYPVTVDCEQGGQPRRFRARYVVGCDGARSVVRREIGRELKGDSANQAWGVMDVLCVTDFPDIRLKCAIHSAGEGSLLIIPREGGYMVRMYIEMDKLREGERVAGRNLTVDQLIAAAGRIFAPYTLDVKEVAWWSVYEIGQRLTDAFHDDDNDPRVFIAGDACHTHSPKAGQGMNMSMQDAFNLGWKLAHVLTGRAAPDLLRSYSAERQVVAQQLIDFDRDMARLISAKPRMTPDGEGADPDEFQRYFQQQGRFTAGTAITYGPSDLTGGTGHQALASGFEVGTRFHSAPVIRLGDAKPMHLGHAFEADGRWRLLAFEDTGGEGLDALCRWLSDDSDSPLRIHTPDDADPDAVIDLRAVLRTPHRDVDLGTLPPALMPRKGRYGLVDYEKVFCPDPRADIFAMRGIGASGAAVILRPDAYVAHVLPLGDHAGIAAAFAKVLRPA